MFEAGSAVDLWLLLMAALSIWICCLRYGTSHHRSYSQCRWSMGGLQALRTSTGSEEVQVGKANKCCHCVTHGVTIALSFNNQ